MLENAELSWSDAPPLGDKVTQGKWWTNAGVAEMAIGEGAAKRLHLGVGSAVELEVGGSVRPLKIAAVLSRRRAASGRARAIRAAFRTIERRTGYVVRRRTH